MEQFLKTLKTLKSLQLRKQLIKKLQPSLSVAKLALYCRGPSGTGRCRSETKAHIYFINSEEPSQLTNCKNSAHIMEFNRTRICSHCRWPDQCPLRLFPCQLIRNQGLCWIVNNKRRHCLFLIVFKIFIHQFLNPPSFGSRNLLNKAISTGFLEREISKIKLVDR